MTSSEKRHLPRAFDEYEKFRDKIEDQNMVRWINRFVLKYEFAKSYSHIESAYGARHYSCDSALFGVICAYKAFQDIAEMCFHKNIISTDAKHFISANDLLHESLTSNSILCEYLLKNTEKSDSVFPLLKSAVDKSSNNVMVFAYLLFSFYLNSSFTIRNVGFHRASQKMMLNIFKNYILDLSDLLFIKLIAHITPDNLKQVD